MIHKGLTKEAATELKRISKKLGETEPVRGVHIGRGPHVKMPETWGGENRVPPGWSGVHGVFAETAWTGEGYEETGLYSVGLPEDTEERAEADKDKLTSDEKKALKDAAKAAKEVEKEQNK
jgi:hypothetical protein